MGNEVRIKDDPMNPGYELKTKDDDEKPDSDKLEDDFLQEAKNNTSTPMISGILLIVAGVLAILSWAQVIVLDTTTIGSIFDISQLQQLYPEITLEQFAGFIKTCATIGCVIGVFPVLGGILSIKRKLWGITLACSILGLFSIGPMFASSVLSLIAIILIYTSKKEFN